MPMDNGSDFSYFLSQIIKSFITRTIHLAMKRIEEKKEKRESEVE